VVNWEPTYCSVLQCVALCCSVQSVVYFVTNREPTHCSVLQCVAVCCRILQCVAVHNQFGVLSGHSCLLTLHCNTLVNSELKHCSVLQRVAVCCRPLYYVAVFCRVYPFDALQCVADRYIMCALQCVADRYIMLQSIPIFAEYTHSTILSRQNYLHSIYSATHFAMDHPNIAVRCSCSALQCAADRCSILQCVAMYTQ